MELTIPCLKCGHDMPDRPTYFFCSNCSMQARCKSCKELLEQEAKACSSCGTKTIDNQANNGAVNNIEFEQKGNSRTFKANFTDFVGENLVHSLGGLFLGTQSIKPNQNPFTSGQKIPATNVPNNTAKKELPFEYAQEVNEDTEDINGALVKIFRQDNEELSLINQRLKFTGKRDHAIRITLVALHAYSIFGKHQISRNVINKMLQAAAVFDNNYLTWLGKCDEIKKVDNDLLELNLPGRDAAIEILKEFINPAVTKGSVHFSTLGTGKKGKGRKTKTDSEGTESSQAKSGSRSSNMSPAKMIDTLILEKYFAEKRRIADIIKYCKDIKGQSLDAATLGVALLRKVKSQTLKREEHTTDKQYEYFQ